MGGLPTQGKLWGEIFQRQRKKWGEKERREARRKKRRKVKRGKERKKGEREKKIEEERKRKRKKSSILKCRYFCEFSDIDAYLILSNFCIKVSTKLQEISSRNENFSASDGGTSPSDTPCTRKYTQLPLSHLKNEIFFNVCPPTTEGLATPLKRLKGRSD